MSTPTAKYFENLCMPIWQSPLAPTAVMVVLINVLIWVAIVTDSTTPHCKQRTNFFEPSEFLTVFAVVSHMYLTFSPEGCRRVLTPRCSGGIL
jgi:hypothetical protein